MKIGINGFGRIGRCIYRINMKHNYHFDIPIVNDINPDSTNVAYQLNYDTTYGKLQDAFQVEQDQLSNSHASFLVTNHHHIDDVDWNRYGVEIVVDASGKKSNLLRAKNVLHKNDSVKKVIVTHSPDEVDFTMVIGANEDKLKIEYDVISSSICDATALAPVLKLLYENFNVYGGAITTVHPLLSYQNVLDGASVSWFDPSQTYTHYALGRSVFDNIIPKPTTAIEAACKILDIDASSIAQFSYRTPNTIVASADITLFLENVITKEAVECLFCEYMEKQTHKIIKLNYDPLVSLDFKGCEYSAVIDTRWIQVAKGKILKMILWYDNEWGYSSRVFDQLKMISDTLERRD